MRSPESWWVLVRKEMRELASSRSWWLLLAISGILVGHAFVDATSLYAEASGAGGGAAALAQGLNPLTGIVVPTLGVYDLVATLVFPFVVIRAFAAERETGALMFMLQAPFRLRALMSAKLAALLLGWLVAGIPALVALAWWRAIGGHLGAAETATAITGHVLRGVMTIGIGAAAGALSASAASAAILALSVTLGGWAVDYAAAARGGWLQVAAQFTPTSALCVFEQGELRLSVVMVMLAIGAAGLAIANEWLQTGRPVRRRVTGAVAVLLALACVGAMSSRVHMSADVSEDRRNSFPAGDQRALASIPSPLGIEVHLAAEDPRLADLERGVFSKLRRALPDVRISYAARGRSGLFERAADQYGEIWYIVGGRRRMSRSATEEIVLETIYDAAGVAPPAPDISPAYPGYPLRSRPEGAWMVFLALWPIVVLGTLAWWRRVG